MQQKYAICAQGRKVIVQNRLVTDDNLWFVCPPCDGSQ